MLPSRVCGLIDAAPGSSSPGCSIQAHAGSGIVLPASLRGPPTRKRCSVHELQPAAVRAGGHAVVWANPLAEEFTRQACWGAAGADVELMRAVKRTIRSCATCSIPAALCTEHDEATHAEQIAALHLRRRRQLRRRDSPGSDIDYGLFLDCVHCGLCTAACPTYLELGNENDSPRGRIYLMRAVTDGRLPLTDPVRRHLELCLDCRACETACPSGVQYGKLIEPFRVAMEQERRLDEQNGRLVSPLDSVRTVYASRADAAAAWVRPGWRSGWACCGWPKTPADAAASRRACGSWPQCCRRALPAEPALPEFLPAIGAARGARGPVHRLRGRRDVPAHALGHGPGAAAERLRRAGAARSGLLRRDPFSCRRERAGPRAGRRNLAAFDPADVDAVIVNVAGCGAMLKDYGHHWHDARQEQRGRFAAKIQDINEFLDELGCIPPEGEIRLRPRITTPAIWCTPRRFAKRRGGCWRRCPA